MQPEDFIYGPSHDNSVRNLAELCGCFELNDLDNDELKTSLVATVILKKTVKIMILVVTGFMLKKLILYRFPSQARE